MEEIKFMNTKQVAQALGCSMPTARQIMMRADFPPPIITLYFTANLINDGLKVDV